MLFRAAVRPPDLTLLDSPPRNAIRIQGLSKTFGAVTVLDGICLDLAEGEFLTLLGPSGCGKTTLLRILAGLETAREGTVAIDGAPVSEARRNQEIGIAFQRPALLPSRTALRNVALTLEVCGRAGVFDPERLLREFGLGDFLHHYPHQLSGGMQQRVNIAAAIVHHPRLLLLDEPFGALDELTREALWSWLARLLAVTRQTAILVTHSVEEAVTLSDHVAVLSARPGRIHSILGIDLPRPRTGRLDEAFAREVVRVRRALYAAVEVGGASPQ
jgi:NitT/TauT family transport system ATP-binding protein